MRFDLRSPVNHLHHPCYKTMIASSTARRLAGVPVAPLLSLELHQHQAVGALLGQQGADSQPAVSDRADGMSKVTIYSTSGSARCRSRSRSRRRSGTPWRSPFTIFLFNRLVCSRQLEADWPRGVPVEGASLVDVYASRSAG